MRADNKVGVSAVETLQVGVATVNVLEFAAGIETNLQRIRVIALVQPTILFAHPDVAVFEVKVAQVRYAASLESVENFVAVRSQHAAVPAASYGLCPRYRQKREDKTRKVHFKGILEWSLRTRQNGRFK